MKKLIYISLGLLLLNSCKSAKKAYDRLYSDYVETYELPTGNNLYRDTASTDGYLALGDTVNFGNTPWQQVFTDPKLQSLISRAIEQNTNMKVADETIYQASQGLKVSRMAYLPQIVFSPQGSLSSFDLGAAVKTYSLPLSVSWQADVFGNLRNAKKQSEMTVLQAKAAKQATQTSIISTVANLYYTLIMLDEQLETTEQTLAIWKKNVEVMKLMKEAGMTNNAAVSQAQANYIELTSSVPTLKKSIREAENAICYIMHESPHSISRASSFNAAGYPRKISVGVPLQLLSCRPDVKIAELQMAYAFYGRNKAEAAFYPNITLSGTLGWTNSAGTVSLNPGKMLANAVAQIVQPLFMKGQLTANLHISESEQRKAQLNFEDALLNAGQEVSNYLMAYQTAINKEEIRRKEVAELELALKRTKLLFTHTASTSYLEKLTAESSLLNAQLSLTNDKFQRIQAAINLYAALGGGRE